MVCSERLVLVCVDVAIVIPFANQSLLGEVRGVSQSHSISRIRNGPPPPWMIHLQSNSISQHRPARENGWGRRDEDLSRARILRPDGLQGESGEVCVPARLKGGGDMEKGV